MARKVRLSEDQRYALQCLAQPGATLKWGQYPLVTTDPERGPWRSVHFQTAVSLLHRGYIVRVPEIARYVITDKGRVLVDPNFYPGHVAPKEASQ